MPFFISYPAYLLAIANSVKSKEQTPLFFIVVVIINVNIESHKYVKNLDGSRRKYKSKKFFTKTKALKAEREFLTINADRSDKDRNMTFKDLYTLFYA